MHEAPSLNGFLREHPLYELEEMQSLLMVHVDFRVSILSISRQEDVEAVNSTT